MSMVEYRPESEADGDFAGAAEADSVAAPALLEVLEINVCFGLMSCGAAST